MSVDTRALTEPKTWPTAVQWSIFAVTTLAAASFIFAPFVSLTITLTVFVFAVASRRLGDARTATLVLAGAGIVLSVLWIFAGIDVTA